MVNVFFWLYFFPCNLILSKQTVKTDEILCSLAFHMCLYFSQAYPFTGVQSTKEYNIYFEIWNIFPFGLFLCINDHNI